MWNHIWNFKTPACMVHKIWHACFERIHARTDKPKPICPVNFFEVGGITIINYLTCPNFIHFLYIAADKCVCVRFLLAQIHRSLYLIYHQDSSYEVCLLERFWLCFLWLRTFLLLRRLSLCFSLLWLLSFSFTATDNPRQYEPRHEKTCPGFSTRYESNRSAQLKKLTRVVKLPI